MLTGRSGQYSPKTSDYSVTGRCQRPVSTDQTCPVVIFLLWNLTGVDQTLALSVWYHDLVVSGHFQTLSPWSNELTGL